MLLLTSSQQPAFSDEQRALSNPHRVAAIEGVQHARDFLPSPPLSPRSSSYSQPVKHTPVYQSPSASTPSVGVSHATATEVPAVTNRLYKEPRYPTNRASTNPLSSNVSISGAMKHNPTEVRAVSDHRFCPLSSADDPPCEPYVSHMMVLQHTHSALSFDSGPLPC